MARFWINVSPKKLTKAVKTDRQVRRFPGLYMNRRPPTYKENLLLPVDRDISYFHLIFCTVPNDPAGGSTYQLSIHNRYCHVRTDTDQKMLHMSVAYPPFNRADRMAVAWA
jgi:hypothetical protein